MGNTARLALPYPENTDPLANMAAAIQALANAIDASNWPLYKGYKFGGALTAGANIAWTTEVVRGAGSYNGSTNVYTVSRPGRYNVYAAVKHDGSATNETGLGVYKNGAINHYSPNNPTAGNFTGSQVRTNIACVAGDTLSIRPQGATTLVSDSPATNAVFIVEWAGA